MGLFDEKSRNLLCDLELRIVYNYIYTSRVEIDDVEIDHLFINERGNLSNTLSILRIKKRSQVLDRVIKSWIGVNHRYTL